MTNKQGLTVCLDGGPSMRKGAKTREYQTPKRSPGKRIATLQSLETVIVKHW